MRIMFSIPVHECPEVILDQIINYNRFNVDCGIILHLSKSFNWEATNIKEENFLKIISNFNNVYINPERLNTGLYNIIQTHISNFNFIESKVEFEYFAFCSSNDLFIKVGLENYLSRYDAGVQFLDIEEMSDWQQSVASKGDEDLKEILKEFKKNKIYGSQIEGTFYKKSILKEIIFFIEQHFNYLKITNLYAREEIYFSTIAKYLIDNSKITNNPFTYIKWSEQSYGTLLDLYSWNINSILNNKENKIFCIKRVDRKFNNYLRVYIREYIGKYDNQINPYIKEYSKKSLVYIKIAEIIYIFQKKINASHLWKFIPKIIKQRLKERFLK